MTLEFEQNYLEMMAYNYNKGRSASASHVLPGVSSMEMFHTSHQAHAATANTNTAHSNGFSNGNSSRRYKPFPPATTCTTSNTLQNSQNQQHYGSNGFAEIGQSSRFKEITNNSGSAGRICNTGSGPNMFQLLQQPQHNYQQQVPNSGSGSNTPTNHNGGRGRKYQGAHRSQSARCVGSQRPKVKRREVHEIDSEHLDLASSESALCQPDCEDSYNPFLAKVPSTGRLVTTNIPPELEMSNNSLYQFNNFSQEYAKQQNHHHQQQQQQQHNHYERETSPRYNRRHSGCERRGSDKSTPEKDNITSNGNRAHQQQQQQQNLGVNQIPYIATPETSPSLMRRNTCKPQGLPKSPQVSRSNSARRVNSFKAPRKSNAGFLDVPDNQNPEGEDDEDNEESFERLRTFNISSKGIVNRGDSFRRRRSRSNSLIPTPTTPEAQRRNFTSEDGLLLPKSLSNELSIGGGSNRSPMPSPKSPCRPFSKGQSSPDEPEQVTKYRVAMCGAREVGRASIVSQFMTSEGINAYDRQNEVEGEETVAVMLNNEESELTFYKVNNVKTEINRLDAPDAFVLVYSVVDRASFQRAEQELRRLQEMDLLRTKAVLLVANKIDLARSRAISTNDGRCLAVSFRIKFTEISVGINHNVDELLVGLLHQIRLKCAQHMVGSHENWCKHRGVLRASVKARQILTWLLGKEDAKFKNCENLHIL